MSTRALPPGVALRPARAGDEAAVQAVRSRAIRISAATHYTDVERDAWLRRARPRLDVRSMSARTTVVAEAATADGPRVVGYGRMSRGDGVIEAIYVDPDFARRGVGGALFAALEDDARARGLPGLTLEASLNSVPFYAAMGCLQRGLDRHGLAPGVAATFVVMDKRFVAVPAGVA